MYPKTIRLLISLDKKECIQFRAYLNSPYFKIIEPLPKLYDLIVQEFCVQKNNYIEIDFVEKVYGEPKIRRYTDHLKKLKEHFERFVALQSFEQQMHLNNHFILEDYLYRKNGCFFEQKHKQAKKDLDKSPMDIDYYQHQYKLEEHLDSYLKIHKDKRVGDTNLQCTSKAIDRNFILKKLCCLVLMHNRQNITKATYDFGFEPFVISYLNNKSVIEEPLINLFYQAYLLLTNTDKKTAFENLNKQLQKNDPLIAKEMVLVLFVVIQNNLKRIIGIEPDLHQQLFNLYDNLLKKNYIQTNGNLEANFFKNVISIGLELDQFDYVEQFIENYKNKLYPAADADNVYAYNKAKFLVYKGEAEKASYLIVNLHFNDAIYKFDLKCLEIIVFYELKEFALLESKINNLNVDLSSNRPPYISKANEQVYRNFIKCVKKLNRFTNPNTTQKQVYKLIQSIEETNRFPNRKWLLLKAKELLK